MVGETQENLTRPPRLASALVRFSSARGVRDAILGDLQEEFHMRARQSVQIARSWYWRQALVSAALLLRHRAHRSAVISIVMLLVLSVLAYAGVHLWEQTVARGAAQQFAAAFDTAPIVAARLVFVLTQMMSVAVVATTIALFTFRAEQSLLENALRRLTILAILLIGPPLIERAVSGEGYSLDFLIPWAAAMSIAIWAGGGVGAGLVRSRR